MKVYVATRGSYSDYRIVGMFAREEDAAAYELGEDVEEFEIHDGPQEVRNWYTLTWYPDKPEPEYPTPAGYFTGTPAGTRANPYEDRYPERRDFDGHSRTVEHRWSRPYGLLETATGVLSVSGWEWEKIRKVFGDLRAEWLYNQSQGMEWDKQLLQWKP